MLAVTPLDPDRTAELWRSLGFADPPEGELFFTDADMEILAVLASMVASGATDPDLLVQMTRVGGPVDRSLRRRPDRADGRAVHQSCPTPSRAQVAAEHAAAGRPKVRTRSRGRPAPTRPPRSFP